MSVDTVAQITVTDGFVVMAIGMGVVFAFLLIMVFVMNITANILTWVGKYFPEPIKEEAVILPTGDNIEIAVAIAAVKALG